MLYIGTGWALARLPWARVQVEKRVGRLHPLLKWLVLDGYGFHEGYFHWKRYIRGDLMPGRLSAYGQRVFDQGLGRSLWFVHGGDGTRVAATIAAFPLARRLDLWRGVGLACAYAGGVDRSGIGALRRVAEPYIPQLARGAAFAAKARERAGNSAECTELACEILCGISAHAAAAVTDVSLNNLPEDGPEPAYEVWQQRIQARFAESRTWGA
jgi:hypothetical protein